MTSYKAKGKRRGGAKLGEGSYGCVISPAPVCKGESLAPTDGSNQNMVAKVFKYKEHADEEWELAKTVHKLDPNNTWSLPVYKRCARPTKYLQNDKYSCDLTKHMDSDAVITYIVMKYGGKSLDELDELPLDNFRNIMQTCLLALLTMSRREWIHMDIKPGNVLYDEAEDKCYLIDFSLMESYSEKLYDPQRKDFLSTKYPWFPPEFHMSTLFNDFGDIDINLVELTKRMEKLYSRLDLPQDFAKSVVDGCLRFANDVVEQANTYNVHPLQLLEQPQLKEKIDIYSLGVTLLEVYYSNVVRKDPAIEDILAKMTKSNPFERISAHAAVRMLKRSLFTASRILPLPSVIPNNMSNSKLKSNGKNNS